MCRISDKIKFCTCGAPEQVLNKPNYWCFHSYHPFQHNIIYGELMPPALLDPESESWNRTCLSARINEPDAFDIDLRPQKRDALEIYLGGRKAPHGGLRYFYKYDGKKWVEADFDGLTIRRKHRPKLGGKVKDAFL